MKTRYQILSYCVFDGEGNQVIPLCLSIWQAMETASNKYKKKWSELVEKKGFILVAERRELEEKIDYTPQPIEDSRPLFIKKTEKKYNLEIKSTADIIKEMDEIIW